VTGIAEARTLARAMHGHLHAVAEAAHRRRAVPARPGDHRLLVLQRAAGNRAVTAWVRGDAPVVQRCGGETHPGCPCAEHGAAGDEVVSRLVELQRAPDGMLARGSSGEQVRAVQVDLNALGATPQLEPDAKFGGGTDTAVRVFQRAHRLKPDGIVGPATSTMIRNERAIKGANFLVPCHTPEKPGPDGPEAKALDEEVDRRGGNLLGEPGAAKVNLTVILTSDPQDQAEAAAVGGKVVTVGSIAALKAELDKHPNIGLLAIISHGGLDGTVRIGGTNEKLDTITAALTKRTAGTIDRVQFLGCNIGRDVGGMKTLKAQVGASAVEGVNCFLETQQLSPGRRQGGKGKAILTAADLPPGMSKAEFGGLLKTLIPGHLDVNNHKINNPDCALGFGPGEKLATIDAEKLADLYFARNGGLIFRATPGGTCWSELKFDQPDKDKCKRTQA